MDQGVFRKKSIVATATIGLLSLTGCGALPIHATFDSLTNETSLRASDDFDYSSFVSISGLVPQHGAQMIFHQPFFYDFSPNSPNYSVGLAPTRTFISERKFPMQGSAEQNAKTVSDIRDGLDSVRLLSANLATLLVKKEVAETLSSAVTKNQNGKPDEGQTAVLKSLLGSDVVKDDGALDTAKVKSALALIAADTDKVKSDITTKLLQLKEVAAAKNVVVTRWSRERRNAVSATLSEWFDLAGQGHEAKSGILVFGDIRTVTLHSGDDFVDMLRGMDKTYREFLKDAGITTFTIQAKHNAYSADLDMEKAVSMQLNLTKDQLHSLSNTFREINLKFSGSFGVTLDLSNSAFLSGSTVSTETRCFYPPRVYNKSVKKEIQASNSYQLLYAVRAQLKDDLFDKAVKTGTQLSAIAKQCPQEGKSVFRNCPAEQRVELERWLLSCKLVQDGMLHDSMGASRQTLVEWAFGDAPYKLKK